MEGDSTLGAMGREDYLQQAMRHRFCVVAPGDTWTTAKLAETIAVGAAGGCLPLLVLPSVADVPSVLPFTRWLDYCRLSFVVFEAALMHRQGGMGLVISKLLRVTAHRAEAMRRELRKVSVAFSFRRTSSVSEPSAAEFILAEACHAARLVRESQGQSELVLRGMPRRDEPAASPLAKCAIE